MITTQGIVLHTIKFGETSLIAKLFTRELGLCSYIIKGVRTTKGRTKQNLLQPMSHLSLTAYNNSKKQLQYIKEVQPATIFSTIHNNDIKMSLLFFMDEVLFKSIKESEPNIPLFDYVTRELTYIDKEADRLYLKNFPIHFLLNTARYLGIEPMDNYSSREPLFNLKEGRFLSAPTLYSSNENVDYFLDTASSSHLHLCLQHNYSGMACEHDEHAMAREPVEQTLNNLLEYYHVHLSDFHNFTSHHILHSVLR